MWEKNCHMWCWNCTMWGWNRQVCEKSMGTAQCGKKTIICDIGTRQYEDEIIKFEKKSKRTTNVWKKNYHMWCWNCIMWRWNRQMWEKSTGITKQMFHFITITL